MKPSHSSRCLLIVNPASGRTSKYKIIPEVLRLLRVSGIPFDIELSRAPGHARELARQAAAEGLHAVLACGGDGTVNEIASGLVGTQTAMGIIPAGSGNGLARHTGIPVDIRRSISIIAKNNIVAADYGTANDVPFFCTFGVGFDAAVSERCAREKRRGPIMYLRSAIEEYMKFEPERYSIEVDGRTITTDAFLVVACNASQYGNNAFIAPQASITDGLIDLTIVHAGDIFSQAQMGVDMLTGLIRRSKYIDIIRTPHARIVRHNSGAAHADGDSVQMPAAIDICCHPGQLRLIVPTHKQQFRPVITPVALTLRDITLSIGHLIYKRK